MKPVTVYTLEEKQVMMYDKQDIYEYLRYDPPQPIYDSDFEFVNAEQCKAEKIQLPIKLYRTIGKEDLYVAWDKPVLKLLGIEEGQVRSKLAKKDEEVSRLFCENYYLNSELEKIRNMSAWETVKVAWSKLWDKG